MNYPRVASRYSKALLELAVEKNELDKVSVDVATLKAAVSGSRDLELLLASPIVKTDKKQAILNEVFKGAFSPIFEGFVSLITKNGRESILTAICEKFEADVLEHKGIVEAEVTTAVALTHTDKEKLVSSLKTQLGKEVILKEYIDASTIGGMKLFVGGYQIDNTVSGKLRALRNQLIDTSYETKF
ncbi:MAG TPA: ATP synthase F1 subunit delta [Cryomorphaceae bacterium]|nr:ATP synthase F1 subunit delta [Cryomorphaceae bacterium]|tara:strand:- start:22028 stop:22585 length:558 start_codon:yes stop_codon:yes gene_type:complete